ncbi:MAG: asparagine synthase-related protein [Bacteroidales bacterium]
MNSFIGNFSNEVFEFKSSKEFESYKQLSANFFAKGDFTDYKINEKHIILFGNIYNIANVANEEGINANYSNAQIFLELFIKNQFLIKKLDGEFTAIIFSENGCNIIRDRHGASLQVYYSNKVFCSNIFDFKKAKDFSIELNQSSLATYLAYGYIPSPQTALKGVSKLTAGSALTWQKGDAKISPMYSFEEFKADINPNIRLEDAAVEFEQLHQKAIKSRIEGKKSIGLFLSGGYDSGGNIHALRQIYSGEVSSFSIGFKNNPWSELPLAQKLADVYSTKHNDYEIDGSEITFLPDIVAEIGDPFQESGLMINYLVNKLVANDRPEIILGGDGNDQHFGVAMRELAMFYKISGMGLMPALRFATSVLQSNIFDNDNFLFKLRFQGHKISHILENDRFGFNNQQQKVLLKNFTPYKAPASPIQSCSDFDQLCLIKQYYIDLAQIVNEVILFKGSKMAAHFDNQLSFPYMSTDIYNFLKTIPRTIKTKGDTDAISKGKGAAKYLHKYYLKPHLPSEITDRKKQGGFAPLPVFFNDSDQRRKIFSYIVDSKFISEFTYKDAVNQILNDYSTQANKEPYWFWNRQTKATQVWNLLVICIWWDTMKSENNKINFI